jgi:hypothetical protein
MFKSAALFIAFLGTAAAAAPTVEATDRTRWDALPSVKMKATDLDVNVLNDWAEKILSSGECNVPGMHPNRFDIDKPYAVLVEPNGNVQKIVVGETGCAGLNSLLGSTVAQWAEERRYKPTGASEPRWYVGRIAFARQN